MQDASASRRLDRMFWVGLGAVVALVLLLPVFPSGDGAVHVYFARILALLATGHGGVYLHVYAIRHLVQPYALHYAWLFAAGLVMSTAWAEKSFVVAILLVNALGFRSLCRALSIGHGVRAASVSAWALPFLLSWALGSGFFNFCFASGVMLGALALFYRADARADAWPGGGAVAAYVGVLLLLVLSHPVPLMALILVLAGEIALRLVCAWRRGERLSLFGRRLDWAYLLLACAAFVGPLLIADKQSVEGSLLHDLRPHAEQVRAMLLGYRLSMFAGGVAGALFTAGLLAAAMGAAVWMVRDGTLRRLRSGVPSAADRVWVLGWLLLLATIVFPESMNGSALFADRMIPLLWPLLLAPVAGVALTQGQTRTCAGTAAIWTAASLVLALVYLLPVAREQAALTQAPLPAHGRGLFVTPPEVKRPFAQHLADTLMPWGGVRAFAAHDDVLENSPWMQLTIVPLREDGRSGLLRDRLPGSVSESPVVLDAILLRHDAAADAALRGVDFLLYSNPRQAAAQVRREAQRLVPAGWRCEAANSYAVCLRRR